jgi:hypothetical protein
MVVEGAVQMNHPVAISGHVAQADAKRSSIARRVLQQLFGVNLEAIDESGSLADFESCRLPGVDQPLTRMGWRIRVKDHIFSRFGVNCELDEPISTLVARIALAERGVRCTLAH